MSDPATEPELTYWDFVREAFNARPGIPGLGGLPLNWMALAGFGTLGLVNPGFWLIGAGLEVGFLFLLAQNPRFRNYVKGRRIQAAKQANAGRWREQQAEILAGLTPESQERFQAFVERLEKARAARGQDEITGMIGDIADDGLHKLRWIYLRLLTSAEKLQAQVDPSTRKALQTELDTYVRQLESLGPSADGRIKHSLEQTTEILRQRIKNLENAQNNLTWIDSELRRIEHQAELIIEEAALATDADALSSRIDAVTATFNETQEWMRLNKDLLSDLGDDEPPRPPPTRVAAG